MMKIFDPYIEKLFIGFSKLKKMNSSVKKVGFSPHSKSSNSLAQSSEKGVDSTVKPQPSAAHRKKWLRLLTVFVYLLSVSMAAILLAIYYTFLWKPELRTAILDHLEPDDDDDNDKLPPRPPPRGKSARISDN